jgi:hypothetical protein
MNSGPARKPDLFLRSFGCVRRALVLAELLHRDDAHAGILAMRRLEEPAVL